MDRRRGQSTLCCHLAELVAEVKYLTWTEDNLLRQVVYEGLREDKPSKDVRRPIPHPQPE